MQSPFASSESWHGCGSGMGPERAGGDMIWRGGHSKLAQGSPAASLGEWHQASRGPCPPILAPKSDARGSVQEELGRGRSRLSAVETWSCSWATELAPGMGTWRWESPPCSLPRKCLVPAPRSRLPCPCPAATLSTGAFPSRNIAGGQARGEPQPRGAAGTDISVRTSTPPWLPPAPQFLFALLGSLPALPHAGSSWQCPQPFPGAQPS